MKSTKFKYSDRNTDLEYRLNDLFEVEEIKLQIVENPTIYNNLPNGIYTIREKEIRIIYWLIDDVWYLYKINKFNRKFMICEIVKDNNVKIYSETEYKNLSKVFKFLDAKTKQNISAYKHFLDLHFIRQSVRKMIFEK